MELNHSILMEQSQILGQSQIQSLEILLMDNTELNAFLQNEYIENPILEYKPSHISKEKDKRVLEVPVGADEFHIKDDILNQLEHNRYTKKEIQLIVFMIESLDANGFLTITEEEIAAIEKMDVLTVHKCLKDLQCLQPVGIFSGNLQEALIRQTEALGITDEIIKKLIAYHLQDIADGKISSITRALQISTEQVRKYIAVIASLNPRPLNGLQINDAIYILPDLIAVFEDGEWNVELNDEWIGNYSLCDYYIQMMKTAKDATLIEYFENKWKRAQLVIASIEQRRKTILKIANIILTVQQNYFLKKAPLKPMSMREVAESLNMHTSTVSRAIRGKYLQCEKETIFLKKLFSGNVSNFKNSLEIKEMIKQLIKSENKAKPYSDQYLAEKLKEEEVVLSRRVIAKYRDELGIKGSFDRKVLE